MIADTLLLLGLYWTIDRRADGGTRRLSQIVVAFGSLLLILLSAGIGYLASRVVGDSSLIQIKPEILPGILFTLVLFGVVYVGFSQALQGLYLSDDMEKLQVAPIHSQAIMTAKLLSRMPSIIVILFLGTIPALIAFGIGVGLGWIYYLLGILLILVTPLFGISLGALIAIFMVRLLPARRLNEWVGAASIVIGLLLSLAVAVPSMLRSNHQQIDSATLATIESFLNNLADLPLPTIWVGRALIEFGEGQIVASAFGALGVYLLITVGLFLVTIFLANRLFTAGWLRMQSAGNVTADVQERPGIFGSNSLDFLLGYKDWLVRVRDPRLLATLFTSLILAGFLLFMMMRPSGEGAPSLFAPSSEGSGVLGEMDLFSAGVMASGLVYFLGYFAFNSLGLTALNIERQAFYILKTAPISPGRVLRAKTIGVYIPYVILTTVALIGFWIALRFSLVWTPYAWMVLMIMGYGLYSYIVSLSFLYPKLDWDDPRQMRNKKSGVPALIGAGLYSLVGIILAMVIYMLAHGSPTFAIPIVILGLAVMAGVTWFFVHWSTRRVEKAWPGIGVE